MPNELVETESRYAACCYCTAKWFCRVRPMTCVRCGSESILIARESPPWSANRSNCETKHEMSDRRIPSPDSRD